MRMHGATLPWHHSPTRFQPINLLAQNLHPLRPGWKRCQVRAMRNSCKLTVSSQAGRAPRDD